MEDITIHFDDEKLLYDLFSCFRDFCKSVQMSVTNETFSDEKPFTEVIEGDNFRIVRQYGIN